MWNDTTTFRRAQRSSAVGREILRSTAALAKLFLTLRYTTRPPSGERSGRRPSDTRPSVRSTAAHAMLLRTFPYTTRRQSGDERTPAVARERRPGGQSPSPGGLPEPFGQARGFFGGHSARPPSPLQYRIDTISGAFLSAIEIWSDESLAAVSVPTPLIIYRRMWNCRRRSTGRVCRTSLPGRQIAC